MPFDTPCRLLLLGATGAVGHEALLQALADPRVALVVAPTRKPLAPHPKLLNPQPDFKQLPLDADWWRVDAVVCALGTTIKVAGSQAAFAAVDRDLPIQAARLAQQQGARSLALNSSLGASLKGNFYLRTKAEAEADIRALGYESYSIVRPSLIDAHRAEPRLGERLGLWAAKAFGPLVPARYRPVKAEHIAQALLQAALQAQPGERVIESEAIGSAGR
jgi:uncharacterized protein YbjT (DUF2867 family)